MAIIVYDTNQLVPSDPEITHCPVGDISQRKEACTDELGVTVYENSKIFRGKNVAGIIGPVACNECELKCESAYITIANKPLLDLHVECSHLELADTPAHIRMIEESDKEVLGIGDNIASDIYEAGIRCANEEDADKKDEIANLLIDVMRAGIVSVGPDGRIELSDGSALGVTIIPPREES